VTNTVNPEFVRPDDNREIVGSNDKIHSHIGWLPQIPLRQTITDMVEYMETNN
jgi:GDP-D-mannose dehydratase